jgi:hypothetical protein
MRSGSRAGAADNRSNGVAIHQPLGIPALPDNHQSDVAGLKPKDKRKREGAVGVFGSILAAQTHLEHRIRQSLDRVRGAKGQARVPENKVRDSGGLPSSQHSCKRNCSACDI